MRPTPPFPPALEFISLKTVRKGLLEDGGILYLSPALQRAEHQGDLAAFTP